MCILWYSDKTQESVDADDNKACWEEITACSTAVFAANPLFPGLYLNCKG